MAASIDFYAGENFNLEQLGGSGLGFFGSSGFGTSVAVGVYQGTTYITDGAGAVQGPQVDNVKWTHANSGEVAGTTNLVLTAIPNYQATLNIRFTNDESVKTQNAQARIFDRSNINNAASGVTTKCAEIIHTDNTQTDNGSGDTSWITPAGSSVVVDLVASPGESGLSPSGSNSVDTRHDWYLAISASPDSIGSKNNYGLYVSLEYL